jgi:hypothetical protein
MWVSESGARATRAGIRLHDDAPATIQRRQVSGVEGERYRMKLFAAAIVLYFGMCHRAT